MSVLMVPKDEISYPSLGGQVCAWIEDNLVFGPGDLRGQPVRLDPEKRALVYRMYEVFPQKHLQAGRRRFKRVALSLRKGSAKTEFAAMIAAAELHPEGPVRCDGWDANGNPVGVGVTDPYIPMVAYTEEQSDELAYGALRVILQYSRVAEDFDIGIERIVRINGDGKAVSLASSPDSRDGARTTFQVCDETHRWNLPRLKAAHRTMLANIPKRKMSDPWSLEVTTAPSPGEGSVAEDTMDYARQVADGKIQDSRLFFFHRQASDSHDLTTREGVRAAVIEASGPVAAWSDVEGICEQWQDPTTDKAYLERVWLNRPVRASERAFDVAAWMELATPGFRVPDGDTITLGFDGARWRDSVALVGTHLTTGTQWLVGLWEKPVRSVAKDEEGEAWEAPDDEIDAAVALAFDTWHVARFYCDPPYWETQVAQWAGRYGDKRVVEWWTNRSKQMGYAIRAFVTAMRAKEIHHDGDERYAQHFGNAVRKTLNLVTEDGESLFVIYKERADSVFKIDAAMAGILSWQARCDALASGEDGESVYETRGIRTL
jgi:phage terminase large subunit-like protein